MRKFVIKSLVVINLALGLFQVNDASAQVVEKENLSPVVQEFNNQQSKLKSLLQRINMKKLETQKKIEQLKSKPHQLIKLELVGVDDKGQYWYDHNAEYEPRIYVDWRTAEEYGIEDYELGNYAVGIFDETGWELFGFDVK